MEQYFDCLNLTECTTVHIVSCMRCVILSYSGGLSFMIPCGKVPGNGIHETNVAVS